MVKPCFKLKAGWRGAQPAKALEDKPDGLHLVCVHGGERTNSPSYSLLSESTACTHMCMHTLCNVCNKYEITRCGKSRVTLKKDPRKTNKQTNKQKTKQNKNHTKKRPKETHTSTFILTILSLLVCVHTRGDWRMILWSWSLCPLLCVSGD